MLINLINPLVSLFVFALTGAVVGFVVGAYRAQSPLRSRHGLSLAAFTAIRYAALASACSLYSLRVFVNGLCIYAFTCYYGPLTATTSAPTERNVGADLAEENTSR